MLPLCALYAPAACHLLLLAAAKIFISFFSTVRLCRYRNLQAGGSFFVGFATLIFTPWPAPAAASATARRVRAGARGVKIFNAKRNSRYR